jgi:hypothetical protein
MKFIPIFVPYLHAVKYDKQVQDELARLFRLWTNAKYLTEYFNKQSNDLKYYNVSVEEAVRITRIEINNFRTNLFKILNSKDPNIDSLFSSLNNEEYSREVRLSKQKAKPNPKHWLRIYALKIQANRYLIIGGAIKLQEKMDEDATITELGKFNIVRDYLIAENVIDYDSFYELILEEDEN